ncbi:MAG: AAA family ATPase, partial [Planctomycetales bacterium]|nr:AAA family ATPase [Planctomycetales bacterium]
EQAAGIRSAAGDWYALGVMLYEAFTGDAPFRGTAMQMIVKKQTEDAPRLSDREGVPEDLATLVDQLLHREPHARPDTATICEVVGVEDETISYGAPDDSESHASTLDEIVLIGREKQLAELAAAKKEFLVSLQPSVVFIRGRSGEGKTSLVEKFLHPLRRDNRVLVLSGRCYDRESVPFKAIDCIIDALVPHLRSRRADEINELLPADTPMLAQLFPVLRRVQTIAERATLDISGLDGRQVRIRAFAALRELLRTISQTTPLVIFIDDLQWGDADSAGGLRDLLTPTDAPRVLLLGSYRSDEADDSPFLKAWRASQPLCREQLIEVSALTEQDALSMLASRVGTTLELSEKRLRSLLEGTRGNPYFIEQLVEGWDLEAGELRATSMPEIIERKLSRLPREAASLLDTIAVAGQAVAVSEAAAISQQTAHTFATITRMRSERLVRLVGSGEKQLVDTYHDKIRETVLDGMERSARRKLHVCFGQFLEQAGGLSASQILDYFAQNAEEEVSDPPAGDRVFDIAYHYHSAGDDRDFAYQLLAGELSHRAYASEDAIQFLERAFQAMPEHCSDSIRHRVHARLGTAYCRQKIFGSALDHLHRAIELAPSPLQKARALVDIGAIHATRAKFSKAVAYHDGALAELGNARPQGIAIGPKLLALIGRIYLLPRTRWDKQAKSAADGEALKQWIYGSLTWVIFENSVADYVHAIFRVAAFAVSSRDPTRFAHGISLVIGMLAQIGIPAGLGRYLRQAGTITGEMDDAELLGTYYCTLAMVHNAKSELALAEEACRRATPLLEKAGVPWIVFAHHLRRHIQQVIGTTSDEIEAANDVLSAAEASGDIRAQCWGNYDVASGLARYGDLDAAKSRIDRAREFLNASEVILLTESIFHCTEGYVLLQASEYEAARRSLEHAWQLCKRSFSFTEFNVRSLPQLLESVVGPEWTTAPCSEVPLLKRLLRESRLSLWVHGNLHSPIHRARGRAFYALGNRRRAVRSFQRAIQCAARLGADYDLARALLDLAAIDDTARDQHRREAVSLLKQQVSVIPYAERWLLGDRYDERVVAPPPQS